MRTIISIDPGIELTGIAVWEFEDSKHPVLLEKGLLSPLSESSTTNERSGDISAMVVGWCNTYLPDIVVVENPPSTIYDYQSHSKSWIVARAQSVFKTVSVAFHVLGAVEAKYKTDTIEPSQWIKKRVKGGSKVFSSGTANKLIKNYCSRKKELTSPFGKTHNMADAICIGYFYAINKGIYNA